MNNMSFLLCYICQIASLMFIRIQYIMLVKMIKKEDKHERTHLSKERKIEINNSNSSCDNFSCNDNCA